MSILQNVSLYILQKKVAWDIAILALCLYYYSVY